MMSDRTKRIFAAALAAGIPRAEFEVWYNDIRKTTHARAQTQLGLALYDALDESTAFSPAGRKIRELALSGTPYADAELYDFIEGVLDTGD